jgi:hypothetical protein
MEIFTFFRMTVRKIFIIFPLIEIFLGFENTIAKSFIRTDTVTLAENSFHFLPFSRKTNFFGK